MKKIIKNELWVPVKDFEQYLEVSDMGRVKHLERRYIGGQNLTVILKERITLGCKNSEGYRVIRKSIDNVVNVFKVHRLVAQAFLSNPENKSEVNHKKGIKDDNRASQLEWATHGENQKHAYDVLEKPAFFRDTSFNKDTKSKAVKCSTIDMVFYSVEEASRQLDISATMIRDVCKNNFIHAKGLYFRYLFSIVFIILSMSSMSQPVVNRSSPANTVQDGNLFAQRSFGMPRFLDTIQANALYPVLDTSGRIIYTYSTNSIWFRGNSPKKWISVVSGSVETTDSLFGKQDNLFTGNRGVNQAGFNMSIVNGNFGLGSTSPTRTLSIGSPGGVETGVLYTPDGTVLRFETRNSAGMSIIAGSQISMQPAAASGQLVFNGMTSNYITQDWYTGGGEKIGEMGLSVYNALLGESQFYLKANNVDTTVTYLVLYDKMKFANIPNDDATTKIITIDANDNVRYRDVSSITGGSGGLSGGNLGIGYRYYVPSSAGIKSTIADNGLSLDSLTTNILTYKLGGTLTQATAINQGTNTLQFSGQGLAVFGSNIHTTYTPRVKIQGPYEQAWLYMGDSTSLSNNSNFFQLRKRDTATSATVNSRKGAYVAFERTMVPDDNIQYAGFYSLVQNTLNTEVRSNNGVYSWGGDFYTPMSNNLIFTKSPAYTGRSYVYNFTGGTPNAVNTVGSVVGIVQTRNSTSLSNNIFMDGYWSAFIAHALIGVNDSINTISSFTHHTAIDGNARRHVGLWDQAGYDAQVDTPFVVASPWARAHTYLGGDLYLGGGYSSLIANPVTKTTVPSSLFDVESTTRGTRPAPIMSSAQMLAISSPATGLMAYCTDSSAYCYFNGSIWLKMGTSGSGGTLTNVATGYGLSGGPITTTGTLLFDSATVFTQLRAQFWTVGGNTAVAGSQTGSWIGSLNLVSFRMRTNNIERIVLDSAQSQLRIGGAPRNTEDGMRIKNPGNDNYSGYYVESNGGTTGTTYGYAGVVRGGAITIKSTTSNPSITPTLYVGGEFGTANDRITIAAGSTTIAPIQMASAALTTGGNIRAGQISFLTDKFYAAITTGPAHKEFTLNDGSLTSGRVPYATTNGRLTDAAELQFTGTSLGVGGSPGSANLLVTGTTATLTGIRVLSTIVPAASGDAFGIYSNPAMTEAGSGTHGIFATLRLAGPNVTAGAGALTRTAAIYMADNSNGSVTDANYAIYSLLTGPSVFNGSLSLATTGNKLSIATGSNASVGTATLISGSVTVNTTAVTANSIIFISLNTPSGTLGPSYSAPIGSIVAGTSFVINAVGTTGSVTTTDNSTINWWVIN